MASLPTSRASLLTLPLEITIRIIRNVYHDEVVLLEDIGSLARLTDIASTNPQLGIFKLGLLCNDLAGRLVLQSGILKFTSRLIPHRIDLVRFPPLQHLRRLHIPLENLNFSHPLSTLSNLPALEFVTVQFRSVAYFRDISIAHWVRCIRFSLPVAEDDVFQPCVTIEELTRGRWRFEVVLSVAFLGGEVSRCEAVVRKGSIRALNVGDENEAEGWRRELMRELELNAGDE